MVEVRFFEPIDCDFRILLRELKVGVLNVGIECIVARLNYSGDHLSFKPGIERFGLGTFIPDFVAGHDDRQRMKPAGAGHHHGRPAYSQSGAPG